jgi:hypothetical protein
MPGVLALHGRLARDDAVYQMSLSDVSGLAQCLEFWIYGHDATIHLDLVKKTVRIGGRDDEQLRDVTPQVGAGRDWSVEADFVASIRQRAPVTLTDFATGVRYMEFTDAVWQSLQYKLCVDV